MSNILFGLALISASLQTSWAFFAEDHLLALPLAGIVLYAGWQCLRGGWSRSRNFAALAGPDPRQEIFWRQ
jgi:hypothetical protein